MKINNTSVRGIFLYSPDAEFEHGDFVVSGDTIYICNPSEGLDSVVGIDPSKDVINYKPYLGGSTATLDYSLGYLSNEVGANSDLYVSSLYLQGILNNYLSGFDEKGIIEDYLDLEDGKITTSERFVPIVGNNPQGIFDRILTNRDLNNAYLRISRSFIIGDQSLGAIAVILGEGNTDIILRQYSYYDKSREGTPLVRVQELVDPDQCFVMYRYGVLSESYSITESSNFKNSFFTNDNINKVVDSCLTYVSNKEIEYKKKYESMKDSFRYKSVSDFVNSGGLHMITLSEKNLPGFDFSKNGRCLLTVLVEELSNSIRYSNSITFDLFDVYRLSSGDEIRYYISDDCVIISKNQNKEINLIVSSTRDSNAKIKDIYYRYRAE